MLSHFEAIALSVLYFYPFAFSFATLILFISLQIILGIKMVFAFSPSAVSSFDDLNDDSASFFTAPFTITNDPSQDSLIFFLNITHSTEPLSVSKSNLQYGLPEDLAIRLVIFVIIPDYESSSFQGVTLFAVSIGG